MFLDGPFFTLKANLHVIPSKPRIKKHNYGAIKKNSRLLNYKTTMG